jgi:hypothetical protein
MVSLAGVAAVSLVEFVAVEHCPSVPGAGRLEEPTVCP